MAQKVLVSLVDDLDGSLADETLAFGLEGSSYEIDLNARNAKKLRAVLVPYAEKARRVRSTPGRGRARNSAAATTTPTRPRDREQLAAIRGWAKAHGIAIKDRGRVPADVVAKFEAAKGKVS